MNVEHDHDHDEAMVPPVQGDVSETSDADVVEDDDEDDEDDEELEERA